MWHHILVLQCWARLSLPRDPSALGYLGRAPILAAADFRPGLKVVAVRARHWLTSGSIVMGVLLAVATAQPLSPFIPEHFSR